MWNTEAAWRGVDDALQIRGGRGYETADSLRARGEKPIPVERMMRDSRINLIFEGSSEIMRLFIAREAVDKHFSLAFPIVAPESSFSTRITAAVKAAPFYLTWYPARWIPSFKSYGEFGKLAGHMRFVDRTTRRLGRSLFHAMVRFGPKLERKQMVLFRAVDIGAELFAMAASCARAQMLATKLNQPGAIQLADAFCEESRERIAAHFKALYGPHDEKLYKLALSVLKGEHAWLEQGIVDEAYYHAAGETEDRRPKTEDRKLVSV
jgi:hypothetical protein